MGETALNVTLDSGEIDDVPHSIVADFKISFEFGDCNSSETGPGADNGPKVIYWFLGKDPYTISEIKPKLVIYSSEGFWTFSDFPDSFPNSESLKLGRKHLRRLVKNNPKSLIAIVAHGFCNSHETPWMQDMKDAFLEKNAIVILVDWCHWEGTVRKFLKYPRSAATVVNIGKWLAEFLIRTQIPESVYLWGVGHSLGAHLMGVCGRALTINDVRMHRISGLDPAGPGFEEGDNFMESQALTKESAEFVDVIHTDGKTWNWRDIFPQPVMAFNESSSQPASDGGVGEILIHLGTMKPMGHLDFYPNWGKVNVLREKLNPSFCSHSVAHVYFIHSIRNLQSFITNQRMVCRPDAGKPPNLKRAYNGPNVQMGYHCKRYAGMPESDSECYYIYTTLNKRNGYE